VLLVMGFMVRKWGSEGKTCLGTVPAALRASTMGAVTDKSDICSAGMPSGVAPTKSAETQRNMPRPGAV